jgi:hypothetical protein
MQWPLVAYLLSRLLLLAVAGVVGHIDHHSVVSELSLFDGQWYLKLATQGYPHHATDAKSTLGFLPLYPMVIRSVAALFSLVATPANALVSAALFTSLVGGLVSAVLVHRLASDWWGERAGRRAVVVFCLFPGSVVFSMAYSECLTLPLVLGCLLALRARRWTLAGVLAALATAAEPAALAVIPVCAVAAARELHSLGWRNRSARRALAAPLLAPLGIGSFAVFLWAWTGTPFAALRAQHYGWHQQSYPLAVFSQPIVRRLMHAPAVVGHFLTLNLWNGVIGGVFLLISLLAILYTRRELPLEAIVWACGIALITVWSVMTPPNPRMLIIAFPAVIVWARRLSSRRLWFFLIPELVLFLLTSGLTFAGRMLP